MRHLLRAYWYLKNMIDEVHCGDAPTLLQKIEPESIALAIWSPPYHVGKNYEKNSTFDDWQSLLQRTILAHYPLLKCGGFLVVNICDILCFPDESMPRIQASNKHRNQVSRQDVVAAKQQHPDYNRYQLAELLKCSEQTIDRRLHGNNIRG